MLSGNLAPTPRAPHPGMIPAVLLSDPAPMPQGALARAREVLEQVMDPEVPVVSVVDLGMIREIGWKHGHLHIVLTPTYSGCPATETIEYDIKTALEQAGFISPYIEHRLSPAWTTDWMSQAGRERLRAYGIAPPVGSSSKPSLKPRAVHCPHCGSEHTQKISEFGSTACKALYRCNDCLEPFDYFKCI